MTVSTYPVHWTALHLPGRNCITVKQKVKNKKEKNSVCSLYDFYLLTLIQNLQQSRKAKQQTNVNKTDKHKNEGDAYYTIHIVKSFIYINVY